MLNVVADLNEIARRLPTEKQAKAAMSRAMRRAITAGRVAAAREAAKNYAIRQGRITERARIKNPTANNPEAELKFSGTALNITDYRVAPSKPDPARRPVLRVQVGKGSGMKPYRGAFLIPVRSGSIKGFKREGNGRLPIRPVYGPSVPQLVGSDNVSDAVIERVNEVLITRLDHEVDRELSKGAKK